MRLDQGGVCHVDLFVKCPLVCWSCCVVRTTRSRAQLSAEERLERSMDSSARVVSHLVVSISVRTL